ncbi:helix-turn-helix transcriptional regulator [Acidocella sp. KAb 2-4]|uniref:helix-turn-helix transcriptional regulator n=1 Tax=Acidocella sp. KAb 2-4 TaxID=2885158 RepID=UPI001D094694|nr:helix-turn-helix transcriptional regulator [Acidocella sp. KAb 2-4]MCB5946042.1 helix-turn-helix transcriptional regulator [Acidocella sp. KAb 2-4]
MDISIADLGFHQRLGHLLGALNSEKFWPSLSGFLRNSVPFDSWVAMVFRTNMSPIVLYEGDSDMVEDALFADYVCSLYLLDPFYSFSQQMEINGRMTPGLYRLDEVAPEHFRETDYYRRYFVHNVVSDEVQYLLNLPRFGRLSLSLGRRSRFTEEEIGALILYTPWMIPLMHHGALADGNGVLSLAASAVPENRQALLEERLRESGSPHLTNREVEVALLLLAGHSTKGIANKIGISPETIKAHRRNLYDKLGVSTHAGLFALFMAIDVPQVRNSR